MIYMIVEISNPFNVHNTTVTIKWIGNDYSEGYMVLQDMKSKENQEEIDTYETGTNKYGLRNDEGIYLTVALNEIDAVLEDNEECEIELN